MTDPSLGRTLNNVLFFTITPAKTGSYSGADLKTKKGQRAAACKIYRLSLCRCYVSQYITSAELSYILSIINVEFLLTARHLGSLTVAVRGYSLGGCLDQDMQCNLLRQCSNKATSTQDGMFRRDTKALTLAWALEGVPQPAKGPERCSSAKKYRRAFQLPHRIRLALRNSETHRDTK